MRGTRRTAPPPTRSTGIIPAYAGNTRSAPFAWVGGEDHPRVCGEHYVGVGTLVSVQGSSPRMRGTLQPALYFRSTQGIIPAYAGNTQPASLDRPTFWDHPRVCGEHPPRNLRHTFGTGSSPRMRGTRGNGLERDMLAGIIPAYAGNTFYDGFEYFGEGDHPRVCGEHFFFSDSSSRSRGSSPRMRGTLTQCVVGYDFLGIIPAYAGNTRLARWPVQAVWDHPRVCGEHVTFNTCPG